MEMSMRSFFAAIVCLQLAGCEEFDGEAFRKYLPARYAAAPVVFSKNAWINCAIAVFDVSDHDAPLEIEPIPQFTDWAVLPIADQVNDTSIVYRVIGSQNQCWASDLIALTGLASSWALAESFDGLFAYRGSILVIIDSQSNHLYVMEG